jgi:hypothetical protein
MEVVSVQDYLRTESEALHQLGYRSVIYFDIFHAHLTSFILTGTMTCGTFFSSSRKLFSSIDFGSEFGAVV